MDAFYASVEQRDNPELRGKPVAVGGSRERGVVAAASYEARKFGIRSAMPSVTAKRHCPDLIFVKPRFDVYKEVSLQIRAIFAEHTRLIEPLSLDEAYLDVTENLKRIASATEIADAIRSRIKAETGLIASAGVSYNKFWPSSPLTTASLTAYSSSRRGRARNSLKTCRFASSTVSAPRRRRK
jgi:DNA polymerase-4